MGLREKRSEKQNGEAARRARISAANIILIAILTLSMLIGGVFVGKTEVAYAAKPSTPNTFTLSHTFYGDNLTDKDKEKEFEYTVEFKDFNSNYITRYGGKYYYKIIDSNNRDFTSIDKEDDSFYEPSTMTQGVVNSDNTATINVKLKYGQALFIWFDGDPTDAVTYYYNVHIKQSTDYDDYQVGIFGPGYTSKTTYTNGEWESSWIHETPGYSFVSHHAGYDFCRHKKAYMDVEVNKTDSVTGEALANVEFEVVNNSGMTIELQGGRTVADGDQIGTFTTDTSGYGKFTGLPINGKKVDDNAFSKTVNDKKYTIKEVSNPNEGYKTPTWQATFTREDAAAGENTADNKVMHYDVTNDFEKPRVEVHKTTDVKTAKVGDIIPFTITIKNTGGTDAAGVKVTDVLPAELEYVSDDANGTTANGQVDWTVDVPANSSKVITVNTKVKAEAAGKVINKVRIEVNGEIAVIEPDDQAEITVVKGAYESASKNDTTTDDEEEESEAKGAKTGDDADIFGLLALMLASAAAMTAIAYRRRRS